MQNNERAQNASEYYKMTCNPHYFFNKLGLIKLVEVCVYNVYLNKLVNYEYSTFGNWRLFIAI